MAARILMQCYYTAVITFIGYFILTIFKKK